MQSVKSLRVTLRACDVDFEGKWRLDRVFTAMQEMGELHSRDLGVGRADLISKNLVWVLTRTLLEMNRYPRIGETVLQKTWATKNRHMIFPRFYLFETEDGEVLGRASTLWVLMDLKKRAMVAPESCGVLIPEILDAPCKIPMPGGVIPPAPNASTALHRPVYSDLDMNGHVNNASYIRWLLDELPIDQHKKGGFSRVLIHYINETRPETPVLLNLSRTGDEYAFGGAIDGKPRFLLNALWRDD